MKRTYNSRAFLCMILIALGTTAFSSCARYYPQFHSDFSDKNLEEPDTDLPDEADSITDYEKRQLLQTYKINKSNFVELYPTQRKLSFEEILRERLNRKTTLGTTVADDVYRDEMFGIQCLEPRFTKMIFRIMSFKMPMENIRIEFEYDIGKYVIATVPYLPEGIQAQCSVSMPDNARKVRVCSIIADPTNKRVSGRNVFGIDSPQNLQVLSGNTIRYRCRNTELLVMNASLVITDWLLLNGRGTRVTSFGPKYFMILEEGID